MASKRHVFTVVGNQQSNRESFYLADTKQEIIMVYEHGAKGDGLGLASARSQLKQYGRSNFSPGVISMIN